MQKNIDRTYVIAPQVQEQNNRRFWVISLAVLIGIVLLAYLFEKTEVQMYAISSVVLLIFFYFQSIKSKNANAWQDWPSIHLTNEKIQIKQANSLLWSKNIEQINSAVVEMNSVLFFSSKALLIMCNDNDSYYISIPKPYSIEAPIESIAADINQRVKRCSESMSSCI